jgi:hypothetical protein
MLTRTATGKLQHHDFTVDQSCPPWLTPATQGTGTIAYGATGATLAAEADASAAILVTTDALDKTDLENVVLRTKAKKTTSTNSRFIIASGCHDVAARPNGTATASYLNPGFYFNRTAGGVENVLMYYPLTTLLDTYVAAATTFYVFDTLWDATTTYLKVRSAADISLLDSASAAYAYTNDPWWYVGDPRNAGGSAIRATLLVEYMQMMTSTDITVTGLPTGAAVRLYAGSTLIDSATETGGTVVLDGSTCDFNSNPDKSEGGFYGTVKVYEDSTYSVLLNTFSASDFWGGDVWIWSLVTDPVNRVVHHGFSHIAIQILDKDGANVLSILTNDHEDAEKRFFALEYTLQAQGGPGICTFKVKRKDPMSYQEDLQDSNKVKVWMNATNPWTGDIEGANRTDESTLEVSCVGGVNKLKEMGTDADYDLDVAAGETASEWIARVPLADTELGYSAGEIDAPSDEYAITTGVSFFPGKSYYEELDAVNVFYTCRFSVRDGVLSWKAKKTTPAYFVDLSDCVKPELERARGDMKNWVQMAWTGDGSIYGYEVSEDTDSQSLHGKRMAWETMPGKCGSAEGQQGADLFIAERSKLKPPSSLTTDKVYDAYGVLVPIEEVLEAEVLHIRDLLSEEETNAATNQQNESNTWEIAEVKVNPETGMLTLSPGSLPTELAVLLAQIENRSNY